MTPAIQPLILCRKCKGAGSLNGEPCPRREEHPGTDPESYLGCCDEGHGRDIDDSALHEGAGIHIPGGEQHDTEGRSVGT